MTNTPKSKFDGVKVREVVLTGNRARCCAHLTIGGRASEYSTEVVLIMRESTGKPKEGQPVSLLQEMTQAASRLRELIEEFLTRRCFEISNDASPEVDSEWDVSLDDWGFGD